MPTNVASPRAAAAMEETTHTFRAAQRPGTAAVVKISAGLDCEAVRSPGFRGNVKVCQFHAAACMLPRGFGGAAGFCVFQLGVQVGTAALAWPPPTQTLLPSLF